MANVSTTRQIIVNSNEVICYATIFSDGTEETDMVIYDSSVAATALGIKDPLKCNIMEIWFSSTSTLGLPYIEFDATTDVLALALGGGSGANLHHDYRDISGLPNYAGTGITGDITLTTTLLRT